VQRPLDETWWEPAEITPEALKSLDQLYFELLNCLENLGKLSWKACSLEYALYSRHETSICWVRPYGRLEGRTWKRSHERREGCLLEFMYGQGPSAFDHVSMSLWVRFARSPPCIVSIFVVQNFNHLTGKWNDMWKTYTLDTCCRWITCMRTPLKSRCKSGFYSVKLIGHNVENTK